MQEDVNALKTRSSRVIPTKDPLKIIGTTSKMIFEIMNKHIPSKMVKNRREAPWLNWEI